MSENIMNNEPTCTINISEYLDLLYCKEYLGKLEDYLSDAPCSIDECLEDSQESEVFKIIDDSIARVSPNNQEAITFIVYHVISSYPAHKDAIIKRFEHLNLQALVSVRNFLYE